MTKNKLDKLGLCPDERLRFREQFWACDKNCGRQVLPGCGLDLAAAVVVDTRSPTTKHNHNNRKMDRYATGTVTGPRLRSRGSVFAAVITAAPVPVPVDVPSLAADREHVAPAPAPVPMTIHEPPTHCACIEQPGRQITSNSSSSRSNSNLKPSPSAASAACAIPDDVSIPRPAPVPARLPTRPALKAPTTTASGMSADWHRAPLALLQHDFQGIMLTGKGGFGSVFYAARRRDNLDVALKLIDTSAMTNEQANEARQEAVWLQNMHGTPHLASFVDTFSPPGCLIIATTYVPHVSFRLLLPTMNPARAQRYIRTLCVVLASLHRRGMVHRDVKPANFLADGDCRQCVLIDLGLTKSSAPSYKHVTEVERLGARLQKASITASGSTTTTTSTTSTMYMSPSVASKMPPAAGKFGGRVILEFPRVDDAGTRGYRPPELLLRSRFQTDTVDMWAVGVMLLEIMTGRFPFFKSDNKLSALEEIAWLLGDSALKRVAHALDRRLELSVARPS